MKRAALLVMFTVAGLAASGAGDILQQLGVSSAEASKGVVSSLAWGDVNYAPVRKAFKAATPQARAAMVEQLLVWTKAYVASPQFAQQYATIGASRTSSTRSSTGKRINGNDAMEENSPMSALPHAGHDAEL